MSLVAARDRVPREPGLLLRVLARIGDGVLLPLLALWRLLGLGAAVVVQGLRPGAWRRPVRQELVRHIHEVGIQALPAVAVVGALVGVGIVLQALYWFGLFGQTDIVGRLLVLALIRELGPLLVSLLLIGRSVSVYVTELNGVRQGDKITALDAMGIDPFHLLVMPRVVAMSVCCFCLTVVLLVSSLTLGYVGAATAGLTRLDFGQFLGEVLDNMGWSDFALVAAKPLLTGFLVALIACHIALLSSRSTDDLRQLLPRTFVAAMTAALLVSGLVSVLA